MKYYKNLHSSTTNGEFKKVWDSLDEETKDVSCLSSFMMFDFDLISLQH